MAKNFGINIKIGADLKKFSKDMQNVQRQMRKTGRNMKRQGQQLSRAVSVPLGIAATASVKFAADFEQSMAKVQAVSGATGAAFKALEDNALELGRTTRFTAQQVAELQLNLSKLGFSPEEITNSTKAILDLALATGEDLADSATVAASTMRGFGISTEESGRVADVMAKSFSSSALDLEKFKVAMGKIAPVAKASGVTLEETAAMMSALADSGVEASTIGTSMRKIFISLADSGMSYKDAMSQILGSQNRLKTATELFGDRAATAALILAEQTEKVNTLSGSYENAAGSASEMAKVMDDTLQGSLLRLRSALEGVAIEIGRKLAPIVRKIAGAIAALADKFSNLSDEAQNMILIAAGLAAAIGPLILIFGHLTMAATALVPVLAQVGIHMGRVMATTGLLGSAIFAAVGIVELLNAEIKRSAPIYTNTRKATKKLADANELLKDSLENVKTAREEGQITQEQLELIKAETLGSIKKAIAIQGEVKAKRELLKAELELNLARTRGFTSTKEGSGIAQAGRASDIQENLNKLKEESNKVTASIKELTQSYLELEKQTVDVSGTGGNGGKEDIDFGGVSVEEIKSLGEIVDSGGGDPFSGIQSGLIGVSNAMDAAHESQKAMAESFNQMPGVTDKMEVFADDMKQISEEISRGLEQLVEGAISDFAFAIGESLVGGDQAFKSMGDKILNSVASFAMTFGNMLIAAGVASEAFQKSLAARPEVAIAAGIALVAIAGGIKGHLKKNPMTYGGGFDRPDYSGAGVSNNGIGDINLTSTVYGEDIVLATSRNVRVRSRQR